MRTVRRTAVFILLGLTLGSPWAAAAAPPEAVPHESIRAVRSAFDFLVPLWGLFTGLWIKESSIVGSLRGCALGDEGCGIDPLVDGGTQNADAGCWIDPWGQCSTGH